MIFITGSSGFLGRELLKRLLLRSTSTEVALLIRSNARQTAEKRLSKILEQVFSPRETSAFRKRIHLIDGDLFQENFGLTDSAFRELASSVTSIYHSAASTALNQDLEDARRINVVGTQRVLEFAKFSSQLGAPFERFFHVSTAYVAGDTEGVVSPEELCLKRTFRNAYEQSKAEAEIAVKEHALYFPVTIFRPSIIVGDSITGHTSAFNVVYIPARFLARGFFRYFPCDPNVPFDVVPVNYVADAMLALSDVKQKHVSAFHICAGVGRESTPLEILNELFGALNLHRKPGLKHLAVPQIISPEKVFKALSSISVACSSMKQVEQMLCRRVNVFKQTLPFLPYVTRNPRFDMTETNRLLENILPPAPAFKTYAGKLFGFCLLTNWGKLQWPALRAERGAQHTSA